MANTVEKVYNVLNAEVGYVEKRSNSQLDSKTANAGSNNYTKYWRDMAPGMQGQPYCNCFVNWGFVKAYGEKEAKKLLCTDGSWSYYTPTSAQYFKNKGQWHTTPKKGDIIYFKNATRICHVGFVYAVDSSKVYTIEGNTSGASGVVANGGGVAKKSYAIGYSRIAGYGRPKYDATTTAIKASSNTTSTSANSGLNKTVKWTGIVTASSLNVRKNAGTKYEQISVYPSLKKNTKVGVCDSKKDSDGLKWYYIKISGDKGDKYGFVSSQYIDKKK